MRERGITGRPIVCDLLQRRTCFAGFPAGNQLSRRVITGTRRLDRFGLLRDIELVATDAYDDRKCRAEDICPVILPDLVELLTAHLLVDLAENCVVVLGHDLNVRPCLLPDKPANTLSF